MVDHGSLFDQAKGSAEDQAQGTRDLLAKLKREAAEKHAAMMKPLIDKFKPALDEAACQLSHKGVNVSRDFVERLLDQPDKPTNMIHFQLVTDATKGRVFILKIDGINASGVYLGNEHDQLTDAKAVFATHINNVNPTIVESVMRRAVEEFAWKLVEEKDRSEKQ